MKRKELRHEDAGYRRSLLIVDDMEINRAILSELFSRDFNVLEARNGREALDVLDRQSGEIAIVLLDVVMPVLDGYSVMQGMRERNLLGHIPVIIITSLDSQKDEARLFDLGASDLIMKPFNPLAIRKRVLNVTEQYQIRNHLEQLVEEQAARLQRSNEAMIDTLGAIIEYRSMETGQHIARIRGFTRIIFTRIAADSPEYGLNTREINLIASASALHDVGKIVIPDAVLNKPGRLTPEEYKIIKSHTTAGAEILEHVDRLHREEYFNYATMICRHHHERYDGTGYPDGLAGEDIPMCAQAVALADCYDALTTHRVYKPAIPHGHAMEMILGGECGVFSDRMYDTLNACGEEFEALAGVYTDRSATGHGESV